MLPNELDLLSWYVAKALGNNDALYWQKRLSLFDSTIVVKIYKACLMTEVIFFNTDKGHGKDKVPKKFWVDYFFPFLLSRVLFIFKKVQRFFLKFWVNWMAMNIICSEKVFNSPQYSCEFKPSLEALAHMLYIPHTNSVFMSSLFEDIRIIIKIYIGDS